MASFWKEKENRPIFALSSLLAISLFGDSLLYNVLPLYAQELHIPLGAVGLLLSINRWVRLLSNPLSYRVFSRFGLHRPLLFFTTVGVITTFMYAQSVGLLFFLIARILWGVTWSHLRLGAYLIVQKARKSSLGLSMGILNALMRLGSSFTVLFGGYLMDRLGYRPGFFIMAGLSTTAIPLAWRMGTLLGDFPGKGGEPRNKKGGEENRKIFPGKNSIPIHLWNVAHFVNMFVTGFAVSSLSLILRERMEATLFWGEQLGIATLTGFVLSIHYSSNLLLAPLAGYLSDYWGRYRSFFAIILLRILVLFGFSLLSTPHITLVLACFIFFTGNAVKTIIEAAAVDISRSSGGGRTLSQLASFEDLGLACGPLFGYLLGAAFTFSHVFFMGALTLLLLLFFSLPSGRKKATDAL